MYSKSIMNDHRQKETDMTDTPQCPFCMTTIDPEAVVCPTCAERVIGKACEDCKSLI